ncbi:MAG: hypothetical protein R3Y46_03915 [Opitutales bacterium]
MKYISLLILFILPLCSFADKAVPSARMGKIGGIHPKAWRISEEAEQKGEGKNYIFKVSIYNKDSLCDSFLFKLNAGAKNTKKSQFAIKGDLNSDKFGTEVSLEFTEETDSKLKAIISLKAKYLENIAFQNGSHQAIFINAKQENKISISQESPMIIDIDDTSISLKIEVAEDK